MNQTYYNNKQDSIFHGAYKVLTESTKNLNSDRQKRQIELALSNRGFLNEGKGNERFNLKVGLPGVEKMLNDYGYRFYTTGGGTSKYFNNDRSMSVEIYTHDDSYRQNAFATIVRYSKAGQPIAFDGVIVDPKGAGNIQNLGKGTYARSGPLVNARPWKTVEDIKALGYNVIDPPGDELISIIGKDARQSRNKGY